MSYQSATLNSLLAKYNNQSQVLQPIKSDFQPLIVEQAKESLSDPGLQIDQGLYQSDRQQCVDQYFDLLLSKNEKEKQRYSSEKKDLPRKGDTNVRQMTPIRQKKGQKKSRKKKRGKKQKQLFQFINPYNSIEHFTGDRLQILKSIKDFRETTIEMQKFGMKSLKSLGSVRAKRQIEHILNYLDKGQLPPEYIDKLQALISD